MKLSKCEKEKLTFFLHVKLSAFPHRTIGEKSWLLLGVVTILSAKVNEKTSAIISPAFSTCFVTVKSQ